MTHCFWTEYFLDLIKGSPQWLLHGWAPRDLSSKGNLLCLSENMELLFSSSNTWNVAWLNKWRQTWLGTDKLTAEHQVEKVERWLSQTHRIVTSDILEQCCCPLCPLSCIIGQGHSSIHICTQHICTADYACPCIITNNLSYVISVATQK